MSKFSAKDEALRRLQVGDLKHLYRCRYGPTLPPDDAGRDDLLLLLLAVSRSPTADEEKMRHEIAMLAPWMEPTDADQMIHEIRSLPTEYRSPSPKELSERLRLTNAERERHKLWSIPPFDMSDADLAAQRKTKKAARARLARRKAGGASRADYLAKSKSKLKPWEAERVSRRTWERRRRARVASPCQTILNKEVTDLRQPPIGPARGCEERAHVKRETHSARGASCQPSSYGHGLATAPASTSDGLVSYRIFARFVGAT